jgi:uncharacterized protein
MTVSDLPLFPLSCVLLPGGPLALRIFETRYLDLVRRCFREQSCFGVVLIEDGGEVGAVAAIATTGTTARLTDFEPCADGVLGVHARGEQRFRILERRQQSDGLNLAAVEYLPLEAPQALPADFASLSTLLRELLPQLSEYRDLDTHYEDAAWVGYRWAELLPLAMSERQELLELDDPCVRLRRVAAWAARQPRAARS